MIKGLDRFKEHFAPFAKNYVLIGGTACSLAMEEAGLLFRTTKDFDIVLYLEALDCKFVEAFWEFVKTGNYQHQQKSTGKKLFYRFHDPEDSAYPEMLELFSRRPGVIKLTNDNHLTPIPVDEEISSLSAILLDEECYQFIHQGKREIEGVPILSPEYLIPLKAMAWRNLSTDSGLLGDEKNIRKHKNDIMRLYQLLTAKTRVDLPVILKQDMQYFLHEMKKNPADLKALGLKRTTSDEVLATLSQVYNCKYG